MGVDLFPPFLLIQMDSLIHLVFLSLSLAKMLDSPLLIKWFSFATWSAMEDLVCLDSESFWVALVNFLVPNLSASSWCSFFLVPKVSLFHQYIYLLAIIARDLIHAPGCVINVHFIFRMNQYLSEAQIRFSCGHIYDQLIQRASSKKDDVTVSRPGSAASTVWENILTGCETSLLLK